MAMGVGFFVSISSIEPAARTGRVSSVCRYSSPLAGVAVAVATAHGIAIIPLAG